MQMHIDSEKLYRILKYISDIHFIPIHFTETGDILRTLTPDGIDEEISRDIVNTMLESVGSKLTQSSQVLLNDTYCNEIYCGILTLKNKNQIIIGPVSTNELNYKEISEWNVMQELSFSHYHITKLSPTKCQQLMDLLTFLISGIATNKQPLEINKKQPTYAKSVTENNIHSYRYDHLDNDPHFLFYHEQQLYSAILDGSYEDAKRILDTIHSFSYGKMAYSRLKEKEYEAACAVTVWSKLAAKVCVDDYELYNINDLYLQRISTSSSIEEYELIENNALQHICEYIRNAKSAQQQNIIVAKCKAYIAKNLNKELNLDTLADQLHLNPSYLSSVFSKHEGVPLKRYIIQQRLLAAQNMLIYSDYTISEIATHLGFNSQSYFGMLFRKNFGVTPSSYRAQNIVIKQ